MGAPHKYPVGVQVFEEIRSQNYLYADKTGYIWNMMQMGGKYRFLSRPRRFGKTLLVSTIEAYFQGRKDLFTGLAIEKLDTRATWPALPVLHFDLSTCKSSSEEGLSHELDMVLRRMEEVYGREKGVQGWSPRVEALIRRASRTSSRGVVVLVDEYDAPLLNVAYDAAKLQRFRETMREFYSPLKACDSCLRFVFITGISKFSQLSIFSELNNLLNISLLPEYAGICGITAEELDAAMTPDVSHLARRLGVTSEECRERLRERYDGYRFSHTSPDIYNPFSLMTAFSTGELDNYWFGSGTPTALVDMLRKSKAAIPELDEVRAKASSFDAPAESMDDPIALMYQSGYLTIKSYDHQTRAYTLGIPNAEVAEGLYESLLPAYTGTAATVATGFVVEFTDALLYGSDMNAALRELRAFLAAIPNDLAAKDEKAFQAQLFLVFKLVGASINTEVRTSTGRIDVVIDAPKATYVMELKYRRAGEQHPDSKDAVRQIDDKGYSIPYETGNKALVKVGIAFSEERRTIDQDWVIIAA